MRKQYLDNIRWITVLIVLVYHVFYLFNTVGVPGAIGEQIGIRAFDTILYVVYPWFMVLLFLIAGISARYSLQKRTRRQFIGERAVRLLVPSTLGLFVYQWITGYLYINIGGGLEYIPAPLMYPISAISGIGPLWFIQTLFLFSLLLVLICKLDSKDTLWKLGEKTNIAVLLLLLFPIWGAAQVWNLPLLTMYRFGIYGAAFLLGYFIFSHDAVQDTLEKIHIPMLIAAVLLGAVYVVYYWGTDYTSAKCLRSLFTNVYLWTAVLAILGCGKVWLNHATRFSEYMAKASFGIYIMHYPIVMVTCYLLYYYCSLPMLLVYAIALVITLVFTPIFYEVCRRIPIIRYWVLGVKSGK